MWGHHNFISHSSRVGGLPSTIDKIEQTAVFFVPAAHHRIFDYAHGRRQQLILLTLDRFVHDESSRFHGMSGRDAPPIVCVEALIVRAQDLEDRTRLIVQEVVENIVKSFVYNFLMACVRRGGQTQFLRCG